MCFSCTGERRLYVSNREIKSVYYNLGLGELSWYVCPCALLSLAQRTFVLLQLQRMSQDTHRGHYSPGRGRGTDYIHHSTAGLLSEEDTYLCDTVSLFYL